MLYEFRFKRNHLITLMTIFQQKFNYHLIFLYRRKIIFKLTYASYFSTNFIYLFFKIILFFNWSIKLSHYFEPSPASNWKMKFKSIGWSIVVMALSISFCSQSTFASFLLPNFLSTSFRLFFVKVQFYNLTQPSVTLMSIKYTELKHLKD